MRQILVAVDFWYIFKHAFLTRYFVFFTGKQQNTAGKCCSCKIMLRIIFSTDFESNSHFFLFFTFCYFEYRKRNEIKKKLLQGKWRLPVRGCLLIVLFFWYVFLTLSHYLRKVLMYYAWLDYLELLNMQNSSLNMQGLQPEDNQETF